MWCVSVLSSGLSTVGVGRNVGSEKREVKEMKSPTSSQVRQKSDEPKEILTGGNFNPHTAYVYGNWACKTDLTDLNAKI